MTEPTKRQYRVFVGWPEAFTEIPRAEPLPGLIQMLRLGKDSDLETALDGIGREG